MPFYVSEMLLFGIILTCFIWSPLQNLDGACIQSVNLVIDEDPRTEITLSHVGEVFMAGQYRISLPYSDGNIFYHLPTLFTSSVWLLSALCWSWQRGIEWALCYWTEIFPILYWVSSRIVLHKMPSLWVLLLFHTSVYMTAAFCWSSRQAFVCFVMNCENDLIFGTFGDKNNSNTYSTLCSAVANQSVIMYNWITKCKNITWYKEKNITCHSRQPHRSKLNRKDKQHAWFNCSEAFIMKNCPWVLVSTSQMWGFLCPNNITLRVLGNFLCAILCYFIN